MTDTYEDPPLDLDVDPLIARNEFRFQTNQARRRLGLPTVHYKTVRSSTPEIDDLVVRIREVSVVQARQDFDEWMARRGR